MCSLKSVGIRCRPVLVRISHHIDRRDSLCLCCAPAGPPEYRARYKRPDSYAQSQDTTCLIPACLNPRHLRESTTPVPPLVGWCFSLAWEVSLGRRWPQLFPATMRPGPEPVTTCCSGGSLRRISGSFLTCDTTAASSTPRTLLCCGRSPARTPLAPHQQPYRYVGCATGPLNVSWYVGCSFSWAIAHYFLSPAPTKMASVIPTHSAGAQGSPPGAGRIFAYGVGGGGDIGVVCAFIHGSTSGAGSSDPGKCSSSVAVGAAYCQAQYRAALKTKVPGREDDWLRLLFSNTGSGDDPLFYRVRADFDRAAVDAIWGPSVETRPFSFKYLTGIDELFIRQSMGVTCDLVLLYSVAFGAKYLTYSGDPVDSEERFSAERRLSAEGIRRFFANVQTGPDEHVLFDVGGDIVDFEGRGRDSNLLLSLLEHFALDLGDRAPTMRIVACGIGVDGHELPEVVAARLARFGFAEIPEATPEWSRYVQPLLTGLEGQRTVLSQLQLLDSHKRATQLFLDARSFATEPFTFSDDAATRDNSLYGRGEITQRASANATAEEVTRVAEQTAVNQAKWRAALGERGSPEMLRCLGLMRQTWMFTVTPGSAKAVLEKWRGLIAARQ